MAAQLVKGYWLGRRAYPEVLELQEFLHQERRQHRIVDTVLLLEHEPVITLGRGTKPEHVLASEASLNARGIPLITIARGGDVTLHAPGQLVCYPIVDLAPDRQDVRAYVNLLTRVMQGVVRNFDIEAGTLPGYVGLWVDAARRHLWLGPEQVRNPKKIGAIGVKISRWVTQHGFALNLAPDLSMFGLIVPCGIRTYGVTSVQELCGMAPTTRQAAEQAFQLLAEALGAEPTPLIDLEATALARHFEGFSGTA